MVECGYCQLGRKDLCKEKTFDSNGKEVICESKNKRKVIQVLNATAVCMKETNRPIIVVVGNDRVAFDYMKNETSMTLEQLNFEEVNVVIYNKN